MYVCVFSHFYVTLQRAEFCALQLTGILAAAVISATLHSLYGFRHGFL